MFQTEVRYIPENLVAGVKAKIAALNKKAVKFGLQPMQLHVLGPAKLHKFTNRDPPFNVLSAVPMQVIGEAPVIAGWDVRAVLDFRMPGPPVVHAMGPMPGHYRQAGPSCDHCNAIRQRGKCAVIEKDDTFKQVGLSCLADYLRSPHAGDMVLLSASAPESAQSILDEDDWMGGGGGRGDYGAIVDDVLVVAAHVIKHKGYISRAKAEDAMTAPTSMLVDAVLAGESLPGMPPISNVTPDTRKLAAASKAYVLSEAFAGDQSDYAHNLRTMIKRGIVSRRETGYVTSAIAVYQRAAEKEERARASKAAGPLDVAVGAKVKVGVRVLGIRHGQSSYGLYTLVTMVDAAGHEFEWFASGEVTPDFKPGATITITGTVKDIKEREGRRIVALTRVKSEGGKTAKVTAAAEAAEARRTAEAKKAAVRAKQDAYHQVRVKADAAKAELRAKFGSFGILFDASTSGLDETVSDAIYELDPMSHAVQPEVVRRFHALIKRYVGMMHMLRKEIIVAHAAGATLKSIEAYPRILHAMDIAEKFAEKAKAERSAIRQLPRTRKGRF